MGVALVTEVAKDELLRCPSCTRRLSFCCCGPRHLQRGLCLPLRLRVHRCRSHLHLCCRSRLHLCPCSRRHLRPLCRLCPAVPRRRDLRPRGDRGRALCPL